MNLHQLKAISRLQVTVTEGMDQLPLKKKESSIFFFPLLHCYWSSYRRRFVSVLQISKSGQNKQRTPMYAYIDLRALRFGVSFFPGRHAEEDKAVSFS